MTLPTNLEELTLAKLWADYEAFTVPPDVRADDFGRQVCRDAYASGAATILLLWKKLEDMGNEERRKATMERLNGEAWVLANKLARHVPS
jgi:hypothetical protein